MQPIFNYFLILFFSMAGGFLVGCDSAGDMEANSSSAPIELLGHNDLGDGSGRIFTDVWGYVDPVTRKEYALVGLHPFSDGGDGFLVVDVSDPASPQLASVVSNVGGRDVKIYQQYAYTNGGCGSCPEGEGNLGHIIDLSDPTQPEVVGTFPLAHNIFITEEGQLYLAGNGLQIFDIIQNPRSPSLLWSGPRAGSHDVTVVENIAYSFAGIDTQIYDVADPANPILLGTIDDPQIRYHHSGWPTEDGKYLFICDEDATGDIPDITVWDISRLEGPERVAVITDSTATAHNLIIIDDVAYVSYYGAGFRAYNVSDPAQPLLLDEFDTFEGSEEGILGAWGVYPFAPFGNIYISDINFGLFIFSLKKE